MYVLEIHLNVIDMVFISSKMNPSSFQKHLESGEISLINSVDLGELIGLNRACQDRPFIQRFTFRHGTPSGES